MTPGSRDDDDFVIPVVEERASISKQMRDQGEVRIRKESSTREETLRIPVTTERVDVQRVNVGAEVDEPVAPWQDGDTLVVPVMEQVPMVRMQWVVREELRITRTKHQEERQRKVRLAREEAVVDRTGRSSQDTSDRGPHKENT